MGQSLSHRRSAPTPTPVSAAASGPGNANDTHIPRRSLPRRILSSIQKPSLRSRHPSSSLALPTRPEQTLRGKTRSWRLSRRHNVPANTEGAVPEHIDSLTEHDEYQVDRDVDEFGVITHRVPDNHSDSPAASTKGKEKAKDVEDDNEDDDKAPIPSTSTVPLPTQSEAGKDHLGDEEVVVTPTHKSQNLLPSLSHHHQRPPSPSPLQPTTQQVNTSPRPFPPPGTLVVVQGVVHTTDVPRSSDRPVTNPIPSMTRDTLNSYTNTSFDPTSPRPSSVPPETRPRNPLSGILTRPASMIPAVSSPSEPTIVSSNNDPQARQTTSSANGAAEDSEDDTHARPHGISMAQGPAGTSSLSASSIDVLGTLLSVAAAATAASLLTGSSEPIFSSGLTSSQPPPPSNPIPQTTGFNSNVPSERPLSPTPTSDAGRMRHVWSSLRDRLGLGNGTHNSSQSNDTTPSLNPGQITTSQPSDFVRPRDPREIMLAEMARAFNLGLGLGGATAGIPSTGASANPNTAEPTMSDDGSVPTGDGDGEQSSLPPPDSFERFLMDLQTDLRVTLMQGQEPDTIGGPPRDPNDTAEDVEGDQPIPELQSLSDSDSEEFGTRHFESDDEDQLDYEDDMDNEGDEEDVHTAQEQPSGRTSPAVSTLGTGAHYYFGGSRSLGASDMPPPHTASSQSISTEISPDTDCETGVSNSAMDNGKSRVGGAARASSSVSAGGGTHVPADGASLSERHSEGGLGGQREGAVLGMAHSREASNGGRWMEAEGSRTVSGSIAVSPPDVQEPSNVPETGTGQVSFLLGTSPSSGPSTSNTPNSFPGGSTLISPLPTQLPLSTLLPSSDPEPTTQSPPSATSTTGDSSMPFRLPFTPSSASRTEHTPGGGINWWRMYRFPAIASPNLGQGGSQDQHETITSRGVAQVPGVHSGLAQPALTPSAATPTNIPEIVPPSNQSNNTQPSTIGQDPNLSANANTSSSEHRSNVVVPVIVVGLQSVNTDRQPPQMPHPHVNHTAAMDDEDGEGMELDGLEQPMSMPLHIPEPPEFRHYSSPSNTTQPEQSGQQPARGRTWQSRAANAIRNLRPSRRNPDATNPQSQETPGSRTFLIYVIGGYYPPDHQIITGGNLDSFEALWELAELLGQVKPPTVSKEEIEKSGLEIIKASMLEVYEKQGRIASNCIDRCLICLDEYNPEDDMRVLTCKHTFHQGCVDRWLETGRNNCPACRTKGVGNENTGPNFATPPDRPLHGI
ncbi:hypothetical protein JVT61DRAFT_1267 [Boletus reticuloceps]|uniref:RING-type domain-containing protein n=1 Tax=Boletus reticuloceps TaxID=495285 RepID=A0A8I3A9T2_9AGAM|nr:hypothetical protein JVT61DRAFT_1267 [Boletus reticuloceps]